MVVCDVFKKETKGSELGVLSPRKIGRGMDVESILAASPVGMPS